MAADLSGITLVSHTTKIKGEIATTSDLRIDGEFEGTITTSGKIVLGTKGILRGKIVCSNADLSGEFNGDCYVKEKILIKATAKFTGSIKCDKISIELGSLFNGNCEMTSTPPVTPKDKKP